MEKMDGLSLDIEQAEQDNLRAIFPQCFVEGKLDVGKLLALCGEFETVDENDREKYEFRWKGKQEALQLAGKRSAGTLRPCRADSVDWDTTQNLYIEGDNLEVLKLLQASYYRRVKMIYIDPPYNTGNDFVYADDFADPLARYREVTGQTTKSNPETMGRYHTNWLNMMYPRLRLAANLLRDDGVIFISIDDSEQANLRKICDEIFGEENFVANIIWQKRYSPANDHKTICPIHDFIMVYQKTSAWQRNLLLRSEANDSQYRYEDARGIYRPDNYKCNKTADERPNLYYAIINPNTGEEIWPSRDAVWRYSPERHAENVENDMVFWGKDGRARTPAFKRYRDMLRNGGGIVPGTWWTFDFAGHNDEAAKETSELIGNRVFSTPKPTRLIQKLLQLATDSAAGDIVLDFFSGSAAAAHAVIKQNAEDGGTRRFICVQLPEVCDADSESFKAGYPNICEIGKARIRKAGEAVKRAIAYPQQSKGDAIRVAQGLLGVRQVGEPLSLQNATAASQTFMDMDTGERIHEELGVRADVNRYRFNPDALDTGFRVFKLASSNLKQWDTSPITGPDAAEVFQQRLMGMLDILKPDRTDEDVVYEVMLKLGQDLCQPITPIPLGENRQVYGVGPDIKFIVCLAPNITTQDAHTMAQHAPEKIIFADQCFPNSEAKSNVKLTLKDNGITIRVL